MRPSSSSNESTRDKILIIGGGPVGLAMAKALRARQIDYDQVEASDAIGGNWLNGVYESTHIISSKTTTEYSDFPMPESYPDFPSAAQMLDYLNAYARDAEIESHVRCSTTVSRARPVDDNMYEVVFEADPCRYIYKGLILCSGHHWSRRWPEIPGEFAGALLHSKDFKSSRELEGKRVLVIGAGNSGCDIASEAAVCGEYSDLSIRDGVWFLPKTLFGRPVADLVSPAVPTSLQRSILRFLLWVSVGDYASYGLPRPSTRLFEKHPTISTDVLRHIKHGRIGVRPEVDRFDGREVFFADGTREVYDVVVAATGFNVAYPYLPDGLIPISGEVVECIGGFLLPEYRNLYIAGWSQPRYGFGPLLTPASQLVADWIELQDEINLPVGQVLRRLGQRPATTHIMDPMRTLRDIRRGRRSVPLIRFVGRLMSSESQPNPVWPSTGINDVRVSVGAAG